MISSLRRKLLKLRDADAEARVRLVKRALWYYLLFRPVVAIAAFLRPLLIGLLQAVEPRWRIRFGVLRQDRIGHLALNPELYLRRKSVATYAGQEKVWFFAEGTLANQQLLKMVRRHLRVRQSEVLAAAARAAIHGTSGWADMPMNTNEYPEWNNLPPQLTFTDEEEQVGQDLLRTMGIEPGSPFVCFHARDRVYLDTVQGEAADVWRYHDYRDCRIENYLPAANFLGAQGIAAVRMGHLVGTPLPSPRSPRVIDYATEFRTDFGDVYLPARCKFFLGNTAGLCCLSSAFNRPSAAANSIGHIPLLKSDLFIVKKLWDIECQRFLGFRKVIEIGADEWLQTERYTQAGLEVVENTAAEILDLAVEMNARLDGVWVAEDEDEELQSRYRALFPPGHRRYGFPCRIGAAFLRQNRNLL